MPRTHIPHLLTHLLSEHDVETLRTAMLDRAGQLTGPACEAWMDAVIMMDKHVSASFQRRSKQTPSARRKSLGYRPAVTA